MTSVEKEDEIVEKKLEDLVLSKENIEDIELSDVEDEDEEDYLAKPLPKQYSVKRDTPVPVTPTPVPKPAPAPVPEPAPTEEPEPVPVEESTPRVPTPVPQEPVTAFVPTPVEEKIVPRIKPVRKAKGKSVEKVFKVAQVDPELEKCKTGLFVERNEKLAARKAFTKISRTEYKNEPCSVIFCLSEVNKDNEFWFQGQRVEKPNPTVTKRRIGGVLKEYVNKYQNIVTEYDPEAENSSADEDGVY